MGKPLHTDSTNFNLFELQTNLLQAFTLWQQFIVRATEATLEKPPSISQGEQVFTQAVAQWGMNLWRQPQKVQAANWTLATKQWDLWQRMAMRTLGYQHIALQDEQQKPDRRFKDSAWSSNTLTEAMAKSYLNTSAYWKTLTAIQDDLPEKQARQAEFFVNNLVDALAPNNYAATNPQVWEAIQHSNGANLVRGMENLLHDFRDGELRIRMTDMEAFTLGEDIATTPGQVVFRNDLMELIQYTPTTEQVRQRPLLIVPPWINKYYILDLREKNSYVKWAVEQGHTVFMISWVNPDSSQRHLGFEDYLKQGTLAAMDAIEQATGEWALNVAAYCLGGTLTGMTLAWLAAKGDERVQSATFFTTLLDFSEPGEIGVFLDEEQLEALEQRMDDNGGYLAGKNMGAAFNMLRSNDLVWSFFVNLYLLGNNPMPFDLLYWNSDSTRMPATMHAFYLRNMYLENRLVQAGGIQLDGVDLDLRQIKTPSYFVSAIDDHIAPWKTTYKGTQLFSGPVRFVLGQSGHIAGIVNPAAVNKYGHWANDDLPAEAEQWFASSQAVDKSWWHDWDEWVSDFAGEQVAPREPGSGELAVLTDAPGTYVLSKAHE